MGIINITPDSFYSGSRLSDNSEVIERVEQMLTEGADIIDIGACSTRPGIETVDENTEKTRLASAFNVIRAKFPEIIISVDTFRSSIAKWAIDEYQVNMINDISGGNLDSSMFKTIAEKQVPYIMMHMRGTPKNMQELTGYNNVTQDIIYELSQKLFQAREAGINDIIIDPGFGFSKTLEQNYELLANLETFKIFDVPVLVGVSRKSMIYKLLDSNPESALNGTTVVNTIALMKGANILRVHDVKEAREAIKIYNILKKAKSINN
jgi:dihydropteroate synthase